MVGNPKWEASGLSAAAKRAAIVVDAVCWARDLVNTPAGDMPPAEIAREAQRMARSVGLTCKVWNESQLEKGGFGGILGVGKGSVNPPRLIELTYTGAGNATPIALTGKGIAFDSGGLSIKDAKGMETMKDDMGGAASILGTMKAIARLKPKINVIAAIPCSENMPSGSAQKPGDVITHRGGKTSEVLNTDAEGRLVLADALALLAEREPQLIVDTATLTGACVVALGTGITGAFGNDDALIRDLIAAGDATGEPIWQMPLHQDYRPLIDSSVADIKNIGDRWGGAITAAWFLAEFVGDTPWCHLDIAGPAFNDRGTDLSPRGARPARPCARWCGSCSIGRPRRGSAAVADAAPDPSHRPGARHLRASRRRRDRRGRNARELGRRRPRGAPARAHERRPRIAGSAARPGGARPRPRPRDAGRRRRARPRERAHPRCARRRPAEHRRGA